MCRESKPRPSRLLLALLLCLSLAACCKPCTVPAVLPVEPHPALREVEIYQPGDARAEYCLSDRGRRDVLIDLEMYRAALEACREVIRRNNEPIAYRP